MTSGDHAQLAGIAEDDGQCHPGLPPLRPEHGIDRSRISHIAPDAEERLGGVDKDTASREKSYGVGYVREQFGRHGGSGIGFDDMALHVVA
ncbi:hypothetical protein DDE01_04180 [Desulfovibrio desulfuricans]|jgi:hypothetical protein|nr:hypothetical protein DDE01_04180 [Desulfovibrio desulfuricans]